MESFLDPEDIVYEKRHTVLKKEEKITKKQRKNTKILLDEDFSDPDLDFQPALVNTIGTNGANLSKGKAKSNSSAISIYQLTFYLLGKNKSRFSDLYTDTDIDNHEEKPEDDDSILNDWHLSKTEKKEGKRK